MKKFVNLNSLASFGAPPAFASPLVVGFPQTPNRDKFYERLEVIFSRNCLTNNGPMVRDLETKFAESCGVRYASAFTNGTVALQTLIRALDLKGEIIVPSFSFIGTAHAVSWLGLTPVFADINKYTCTIEPESVKQAITSKTSAIIGVHLFGNCCDIDNLRRIADKYNLRLIFDAAQAFGCSCRGSMIGSFGEAEVFSLHATKVLHGFEGGMITTQTKELHDRLCLLRNFGFTHYDRVESIGTNAKMTEPAAAMALTNLENFEDIRAHGQKIQEKYSRLLSEIPGIQVWSQTSEGQSNNRYIVILVAEKEFGLSRDQLYALCHYENIIARRYFYPGCHRMAPYNSRKTDDDHKLQNTLWWAERCLVLPNGPLDNLSDIEVITNLFWFLHANAAEVKQELEKIQ